MKKRFILLFFVISVLSCSSCVKRKCRDSSATNGAIFSSGASDNSLCVYSKVAFYLSSLTYWNNMNFTINKVELYINQVYVGDISAAYPSGPGNCTATGALAYQFSDKNPADWEAKIFLNNGSILFTNGTISPSSTASCLIQDVAPQ